MEWGTLVVDRGGWEVIPEDHGGKPEIERMEYRKGDGQRLTKEDLPLPAGRPASIKKQKRSE